MKVVNGVQVITLEVDPNTWNVIHAGLNELPRKVSEPVVQNLTLQVLKQVNPPPASADEQPVAAEPLAQAA